MIKIIKAQEQHIPEICKLWLEFMKYSEDIDPIFAIREGAEVGFEKGFLRPAMQNNNGLVLVALDGKKIIAYSYSQIQQPLPGAARKKWGVIEHLFITANYRRRGIGEKMYGETLKWFHSQDIDRVELMVIANNKAANSFWRKHGFGDFEHTLYKQI